MTKVVALALTLVAAAGCKKHSADTAGKGSGSGSGSGPTIGSTNPADASAPKPVTGAQISQRFEECWGFRNDGNWDAFKSCFADDAVYDVPGTDMPALTGNAAIVQAIQTRKTAFPDMKGTTALELVNGHDLVAITLVTGTNSGPMKMPEGDQPPTNNKVGFFTSEAIDVDDLAHVKHESEYLDMATLLGQLHPSNDHVARPAVAALPHPKEVVIATNDDKEKANLAADKQLIETFNKHDAKAFEAALDNDLVWFDATQPADLDKKAALAKTTQLWKAVSNASLVMTSQWAAGAYTVMIGELDGDPDVNHAKVALKTTMEFRTPFLQVNKYDGGKLRNVWVFDQSQATPAK